MEIHKAANLGLCFGVRRALKLLYERAKTGQKIEVLGPLVHNQQIVRDLGQAGITSLDSCEQIKETTVAIPTHGISPSLVSQFNLYSRNILDATCPIVKKAQNAVHELIQNNYNVIIYGDEQHSEVQGLLGWSKGKAVIISAEEQIPDLVAKMVKQNDFQKVGVISQTTQTWSSYSEFIEELMTFLWKDSLNNDSSSFKELRVINTLCQETQKRQNAAVKLAERNDLVIVVGGYNSANTRRLTELCSQIVTTYQVETVDDILESWTSGLKSVGVTAGASTPDDTIEDVVNKLKSF
jgi:4-hydroxy-3-methylbut-2-enyl diphosphate reductase